MSTYVKLIIPFGSKKYISQRNGFRILGNAIYVFDLSKQQYIDEYIEVIKSNFRITDAAMVKPTTYYNNKKVRQFRNKFLEQYYKDDPLTIKNVRYQELNQDQINKINAYFKNCTSTVRTMFSCLSGSNISGAQLDFKATQMVYLSKDEFFGCNFANVLKKFTCPKKYKTKSYSISYEYTLPDFLNNNVITDFRKVFDKVNYDIEYKGKIESVIKFDNYKEFTAIKKEITDFIIPPRQQCFLTMIQNNNFSNSDKEKVKNTLRSYYTANIKKAIKDNLIPIHSANNKQDLKIIENAHIIQFASLIKSNNYQSLLQAIDPFNCLRVEKNIHAMYDANKIYFDLNGNVIDSITKTILYRNYLNLNNMAFKTINYISLSNKLLSRN